MRIPYLAFSVVLAACGGTSSTDIPDSGTGDGSNGADGTTNDGATTDGNPGDANPIPDASIDAIVPFNPANVSGLVLWLEGDVGGSITQANGHITQWADQTSHHNDAKGVPQNALRNPTVAQNQINNLDAVHFDMGSPNAQANMLVVTDNADQSLRWGTGDFFVAIVGEFDNDPQDSDGQNFGVGLFMAKTVLVSSTSTNGFAFYGNIPGTSFVPTQGLLYMTASAIGDFCYTGTAYNTMDPHLFVMRRQGQALELFVDGTSVNSVKSTTNADISNASTALRIGADGDANVTRLDGDIGEIYAVKGVVSSSDQQNIASYLKKKWATP